MLRRTLRSFTREPRLVLTVVLTLAVGIGANAAVFAVIEALLLRPLPFPDGDRLVQVFSIHDGGRGQLSIRELADLNERARLFDGFAAYRRSAYNLSGGGLPPEHVTITMASSNLFDVLGVKPLIGASWPSTSDWRRAFDVVISHDLWTRRFNGDPAVIGQPSMMDAYPNTIKGVMPPGFSFPRREPVLRCWGISGVPGYYEQRDVRTGLGVARLKPGVSLDEGRAEVEAIGRVLAETYPATNAPIAFGIAPLREVYVGNAGPYLWLLGGAVACVWLIACVNVANLLLSRAMIHRRDMAVRLALGARMRRLLAEVLTEAVVLSAASTMAAAVAMQWMLTALASLLAPNLPPWMDLRVNWRVLSFVVVLSAVTAIVAAVAPLWWLRGRDPIEDLGSGTRSTADSRPMRALLVSAQVAFAMLLAVGAALTLRSFVNLMRVDVGFNPHVALTFRTGLSWNKYGREEARDFTDRVSAELRRLAAVEEVAYSSNLPLTGYTLSSTVATEGQPSWRDIARNPLATVQSVSANFHRMMEIPLLQGRLFDDHDRSSSQLVAVVSRRFAQRFWPGQDAIGKRIMADGVSIEKPRWASVVGIVGDVRCFTPAGDACLDVYLPFKQAGSQAPWFVVRSKVVPQTLIRSAQEAVARVDAGEPISEVAAFDEAIAASVWERRTAGAASGAFAAVAVALAAIGVYGVMSYSVARRRRELAIRAALGAVPRALFRLVVADGLRLALPGIGIGIAASLAMSGLMGNLLYGVSAADPPTLVGAVALLTLTTVLACWLPARRSATADPAATLRHD